jgi:hypothetical protein
MGGGRDAVANKKRNCNGGRSRKKEWEALDCLLYAQLRRQMAAGYLSGFLQARFRTSPI